MNNRFDECCKNIDAAVSVGGDGCNAKVSSLIDEYLSVHIEKVTGEAHANKLGDWLRKRAEKVVGVKRAIWESAIAHQSKMRKQHFP